MPPVKASKPLRRPELKPLERNIFGHLSNWLITAFDKVQKAWFGWAKLNQHAAWFPFALAAVVGLDAVIIALPGDVLVALAILSNAGAWKRTAAWSGLGSALGAFALYLLLWHFGKAPLDQLAAFSGSAGLGGLNESLSTGQPDLEAGLSAMGLQTPPTWATARDFFNRHGLVSLALGSVIPFFSWPLVVIAGLSTDRWLEVFFWLFLGRQARYWILGFGLREGWAMFQAFREEALENRQLKEAQARRPGRRRTRKSRA